MKAMNDATCSENATSHAAIFLSVFHLTTHIRLCYGHDICEKKFHPSHTCRLFRFAYIRLLSVLF